MKLSPYFMTYKSHSLIIAGMGIAIPMAAFASSPLAMVCSSPVAIVALFFAVLAGAVAVLHCIYRHYGTKQCQRFLRSIPPHIVAGYYRFHIKTGEESFSEGLRHMLGMPSMACRFEELKQCLSVTSYERLKELCETGLYTLEGNNTSVIVPLSLPGNNSERWFECTLMLEGNEVGQDEAVLIWFREVSRRVRQQQEALAENDKLKIQLDQIVTILDAIPFPIWGRDASLAIYYTNATYKNITGYKESAEKFLAIPGAENHMMSLAQQCQTAGKMQQLNRHIVIEGARRLFQFSEMPMVNGEGTVGVGYDISRQEEIEKELQFHISAQSALLESSSSAMAIYGADTTLKFFNQAFMKLWGLDEVWLAGQPSYGLVLDVLREKRKLPEQINFLSFKQGHLKLFTDITEPYNEFFHLPDGRSIRMIAIPHALGGVLFAYEDMTDRLALESSYNMLAAVQRATLDNLHEGVAVIGQDGRLKLYNPVYAQMWYHEAKMLNTKPHFSDLVETAKYLYKYDGSWEVVKQRVLAMLSNRIPLKERIERHDGKVIERLCVPLPDGATLMSYLDVTDSIRMERSLRERNASLQEVDQIKTEFLANISYELRAPLTSIMGLSEALGKHYLGQLTVQQKEYVDGIYASSQQLLSIINDILDLTCIEAGNMELDVERFNIYAMLSSVVALMKERIKDTGIIFDFRCPESIDTMVGDELRIKQVVLKLLMNAIEFTPKDGRIVLGANEDNGYVVIWVEDTGEGIAIEDQQAVFNKFYRTENARIRGKGGAGLGLSVVKSFIELHEGRIELESTLGVGTTIRCIVPKGGGLLLSKECAQEARISYVGGR